MSVKKMWIVLAGLAMLCLCACSGSGAGASLSEEDGYYLINTVEDLVAMRELVASGSDLSLDQPAGTASYRLTADLDLTGASASGEGWEPIGAYIPYATEAGSRGFSGIFDGGDHTIKGLRIQVLDPSDSSFIGLFGYTPSATIQNLTLEDCQVYGGEYTGAVAGGASSLLDMDGTGPYLFNCHVTGTVTGTDGVGGLAGTADTVQNSSFDGLVRSLAGSDGTGGLAGEALLVSDSFAYADVEGGHNVGGLAGQATQIVNCYSLGWVWGDFQVGGLAGTASFLSSSYSTADVYGLLTVGGLVGQMGLDGGSYPYGIQNVCAAGKYIGYPDRKTYHRPEEGEEFGLVAGVLGPEVYIESAFALSTLMDRTGIYPADYYQEMVEIVYDTELTYSDFWSHALVGYQENYEAWKLDDGYYPRLSWEAQYPREVEIS